VKVNHIYILQSLVPELIAISRQSAGSYTPGGVLPLLSIGPMITIEAT